MEASVAAARDILTGLHDVMARKGAVQAKLDRVVDLIAEAMSSEVCSIYILKDNALELFATHGLRKEAVHVTRLKLGEGLVGTIADEGRILNLAEAASHPNFAYRPETGEERFHSFAGVPIIRRERAIGCRRRLQGLRYARRSAGRQAWLRSTRASLVGERRYGRRAFGPHRRHARAGPARLRSGVRRSLAAWPRGGDRG